MVQNKNSFAEFVVSDLLSDFTNIHYRAMFGGFGIYKDDVMFGLIAYDELYFKVSEESRIDYEKVGSHPFVYTGHKNKKSVTMSYWLVPPDIMDDHDEIITWVQKAYEIALKQKKQKC